MYSPETITLVVRACDTSRCWRTVLSVRHITGSAYERATHHGVGVRYRACDTSQGRRTSVRHITGSAYEHATHHGVGVQACDTPRGRRTGNKQAAENDGAMHFTTECGQ